MKFPDPPMGVILKVKCSQELLGLVIIFVLVLEFMISQMLEYMPMP